VLSYWNVHYNHAIRDIVLMMALNYEITRLYLERWKQWVAFYSFYKSF